MVLVGSCHRHDLQKAVDKRLDHRAFLTHIEDMEREAAALTATVINDNNHAGDSVDLAAPRLSNELLVPDTLAASRFSVTRSSGDGDSQPISPPTLAGDSPPVDELSRHAPPLTTSLSTPSLHRRVSQSRREWQEEVLEEQFDWSSAFVDEAPFQVVEKMSLYKLHSMFSLLGIHTAYATSLGRLVGVVSLSDVRRTLERLDTHRALGYRRSIDDGDDP